MTKRKENTQKDAFIIIRANPLHLKILTQIILDKQDLLFDALKDETGELPRGKDDLKEIVKELQEKAEKHIPKPLEDANKSLF